MELVLVGYGNMAKAILGGLLQQRRDVLGIDKIRIMGRAPEKIESWIYDFLNNHAVDFESSHISFQRGLEIDCENVLVLLCCKPYNLEQFTFKGYANIVYSVLAGIDTKVLRSHISAKHYVLIMPNVGALHACSSNSVFWSPNIVHKDSKTFSIKDVGNTIRSFGSSLLTSEELDEIKSSITHFVSSFGNCVFLDSEKKLHASIATNGSSPAILALVAHSLINAGVNQGLSLQESMELVQKSFEGVAMLLKNKSPQEIKDSVTSPAGTTTEALLHCDIHGVQGLITESLIRAVKKASSNS